MPGCAIVSAGCTHCYAMEMARRLEAMGVAKYQGLIRRSGARTIWNGVVREDAGALAIPYGWKKPRKIFVNSMSDLFHEGVSDAFILEVWRVMRETPHHHYQILTKRADRLEQLDERAPCAVQAWRFETKEPHRDGAADAHPGRQRRESAE